MLSLRKRDRRSAPSCRAWNGLLRCIILHHMMEVQPVALSRPRKEVVERTDVVR